MNYECNSGNEISKRRSQDLLKLCGYGIVLFAVWDLVRFGMQLLTGLTIFAEDETSFEKTFEIIYIVIMMVIDSCLRAYIWSSAVHEGNGGKPHNFYLFLTGFLVLADLVFWIVCFLAEATESINLNMIIETVIDLTSEFVLIELIIEAVKLRRINKIMAEEG